MPEPNHLTGSESVRISRSRATVIAQFEDLEHHNTHAVHDGLTWTVLEQDGQERIIRVGRKTARLFWKDEDLVLFITAGPGKGSTIYHRFKEVSNNETEVEMAYEVPLPRLLCFLAPLVRWMLHRDIKRGLLEDKRDLEEHGYPR